MRIIPVNCITHETTLAKTIYNASGNILLKKGSKLTSSLLQKVKNSGIHTLYIDDGYSEVEIEDVIKPELRYAAVKTIKDTFKSIEQDLNNTLHADQKLKKRLKAKVMSKYVSKLRHVADAIIEDIMKSHNLLINVIDIKHLGEYAYEHALSVAILSLITGIELRMNKHDLFTLFTGAILHDLGKVFVPEDILSAGDNMTEEEYEEYKSHPQKGYDYLRENKGFAATAKIVILQHHENFDGSGFPNGTYGKNIHRNARIVSICDTYDKMVSDSKGSPAIPANEALEYIMGSAGSQFDFDIANVFVRKINPYPIGTLVDLSSGHTAVVIGTNSDYPLRPIVQILKITQGNVEKKEVIDLLIQTDVTIKQIRYKDIRDEE